MYVDQMKSSKDIMQAVEYLIIFTSLGAAGSFVVHYAYKTGEWNNILKVVIVKIFSMCKVLFVI